MRYSQHWLFVSVLTCAVLRSTSGSPHAGWMERLSGGWSVCVLFHTHQRLWLPRAKIWLERQDSKRLQGPPQHSMKGYSDVQQTCFIFYFLFSSISNVCIGNTEVRRDWYEESHSNSSSIDFSCHDRTWMNTSQVNWRSWRRLYSEMFVYVWMLHKDEEIIPRHHILTLLPTHSVNMRRRYMWARRRLLVV